MSQLKRADALRADLKKFFPELDRIKQDLERLLDEAQNVPPHGNADGTVSVVQYRQLRGVERAVRDLLLSLDSIPSPSPMGGT
jgi:hypothetical protein